MKRELELAFDGKNYSEDEIKNILFNDIIVKKIKYFKQMITDDYYQEFLKDIWEHREKIIYISNNSFDNRIDNISIELNNKIIEISHFFKNHNMPFYENISKTSLARVVLDDLFSYYDLGIELLHRSYETIKEVELLPEEFESPQKAADFISDILNAITNLTKYQRITNKLWEYNFENYIFSSIMNEYFCSDDKEHYMEKINIYVNELKMMKMDKCAKEIQTYFNKIYNKDFKASLKVAEEKTTPKTIDSNEEKLFEFYQQKISEIRNLIEEYELKDRKILNAGILLNNKVVELAQIFKKKGYNFYNFSTLAKTLLILLEDYYKKAYIALKNNSIEEYNEYCSDLYNFTIDNFAMLYFGQKPSKIQNNTLKEKIFLCKKELTYMGYLGKEEER